MEITDNDIAKIEIRHPEVWSLAARLSDKRISFSLHSLAENNSLKFGKLDFAGGEKAIKSLESAVYDNPFFLYNYDSTTFLIESNHFLLIPDEFSGEGDITECTKYYKFLYPEDNLKIYADKIGNTGVTIAYGINPEIDSFLRRTFNNPPIKHILTPIIKYFRQNNNSASSSKMLAYFTDGKVEITALRNGKILFANYFQFKNADDAFYYLMNAWNDTGLNSETDELQIIGDKEMRQLLIPKLRNYITNVRQAIFPAQLLNLGNDAMSAPFDLIILPICE